MKLARESFFHRVEAAFAGTAPALPLALARVALGAIALVRTTDVGRGVIAMNHHTWMKGIEYAPNVDPVAAPALVSPLVWGASLSPTGTWLLVAVRTLSAITLLFGVRARTSAALLALSGLWLMAADRYRYLHHLLVLFSIAALFAFVPSAERLSLENWLKVRVRSARGTSNSGHPSGSPPAPGSSPAPEVARFVPRWSLQLLRVYCAAVYFASGVAKLRPGWLSGQTLQDLERVTLIGGPTWQSAVERLGYAPLAALVCLTELALAPLLLFPRTRRYGVALGLALHAGVVSTMEVSTFTGQMVLLLSLFLIPDRPVVAASALEAADLDARLTERESATSV